MCIQGERPCDSTADDSVHDEVQSANQRQLVSDDVSRRELCKMSLHALGGHVSGDKRVMSQIEDDQRHIEDRALVAASGVGDAAELHAVITCTSHRTRSRGMNVDPTDNTSRVAFIAPPPPEGPLV